VPIGIWQPVILRATGPVGIHRPHIITSLKEGKKAQLSVSVEVKNLSQQSQMVILTGEVEGIGFEAEELTFGKELSLPPDEMQVVSFRLEMKNPRLWWPNGMGDQPLYQLKLTLRDAHGRVSDELAEEFGVRELKLVQNEEIPEVELRQLGDVCHIGKAPGRYAWTFQVNGKKMFAKGANWVPIDCILRLDKSRYEHLLLLAKKAHFNLLRVWGGGLYETDEFYRLCDRHGILVWQEFLSNKDFSKITKDIFLESAKENILRLRNHPSLALWCGGNEFDPDDVRFKEIIDGLGKLLQEMDSVREFHRASPYKGDEHHWGVWHRKQPYTAYRVVRPFRSEAGINCPPVLRSLKKFMSSPDLWPINPAIWVGHGERGRITHHMERLHRYANEYGISQSAEQYILKSQLAQAIGDQFNMEFCRANKFKNSGLLFWQFNDCWPAISWSIVDWYGVPKPAYYFVKRACGPLHASVDYLKYFWDPGETFQGTIYLLNDGYEPATNLHLEAKILDLSLNELARTSLSCGVGVNQSLLVGEIEWPIPRDFKKQVFFVYLVLKDQQQRKLLSNLYWLATSEGSETTPSELTFSIYSELNKLSCVDVNLSTDKHRVRVDDQNEEKIQLTLSNPSDHLVFLVGLDIEGLPEGLHAYYSDNWFHLMAKETREIEVTFRNWNAQPESYSARIVLSGWNAEPKGLPIQIQVSSSKEG